MNIQQQGVAINMALAILTTIGMFILAGIFTDDYFGINDAIEARLTLLASVIMAPALMLLVCIARLAKHRFFTPADINGSGLTVGTSRANLLQALLQNTLEQLALALPVYIACALLLPSHSLGLLAAAAAMFFIGRILFYVGYAGGAKSRALGFGLTFYPTVMLLGIAAYTLLSRYLV